MRCFYSTCAIANIIASSLTILAATLACSFFMARSSMFSKATAAVPFLSSHIAATRKVRLSEMSRTTSASVWFALRHCEIVASAIGTLPGTAPILRCLLRVHMLEPCHKKRVTVSIHTRTQTFTRSKSWINLRLVMQRSSQSLNRNPAGSSTCSHPNLHL